ncbi:MAG: glycosyltransferase family 2 protein [Prevotella sp.]|nr:glycosyltransferase family 2 protein [Prevotella sp.]
MKKELSILIPVYNADCRQMVTELSRQAETIDGLHYEIIVADDGSSDRRCVECCREVGALPHCRFIDRGANSGRAVIRNFLATQAQYGWLLFLDCDMTIVSPHYLQDYLDAETEQVAYGGYTVGTDDDTCLRYIYERQCEHQHRAEERRKRPFLHFHTCNFMVRRGIMLEHPFDERFRKYGYEDVFWGKQLRRAGIAISHIDNPVGFCTFEDNPHFVAKTEEGLRTLYEFRDELRGYSQIITFTDGIHIGLVKSAIRLCHHLFGSLIRRNLCGNRPKLSLFKMYKLGYYLSLT